jgi:hypothetical protein
MSQNAALDAHAVRRRAHERWQQRGCPADTAEQDWLEAERELFAEAAHVAATARELACVAVSPTETRPLIARRAPRSIITRSASAPAARLLVALVPAAAETLRAPVRNLTPPRRSR